MTLEQEIEDKAKELTNIYWQNDETKAGWHWDNSGEEYKDDFRRIARKCLEDILRARLNCL